MAEKMTGTVDNARMACATAAMSRIEKHDHGLGDRLEWAGPVVDVQRIFVHDPASKTSHPPRSPSSQSRPL